LDGHMGGMWTKEHRARQLAFERGRRYPTDLTDAEWEQVRPLLPKPARRGRTPGVDLREVLNAIRYMARSGGGWRMLPIHFGPWQTVYWWFRRLVRRLLFQTVHDIMLMLDREQAGREASPTAGVVDSQTIKAPNALGGGGYDAAKKVKGRKRHVAVDTDGRLLMVNLTAADVQDAAGAEAIVKGVRRRWPWLKHLFADGAYDRGRLASLAAYKDFTLEVVRKLPDQKGFQVLPRRWVVERTFGWMTRWRRLVRDYEKRLDVSDAMIHLSMGALLLRRVAHPEP
jgi:putative transposase